MADKRREFVYGLTVSLQQKESGFVLAATLWILAAITIGVGFFSSWTNMSLERAQFVKDELQGEIDQVSTEALALYLVATRKTDLTGIIVEGEGNQTIHVRLDDRPYSGVGRGRFAYQDESGLLKLSDLPRFPNFLEYVGVASSKTGPLVSKYLDYTDSNDEKLLNGAEAGDYKARGLPPPPDRPLFTSWEAFNILDWAGTKELWQGHSFPRMTTTIDIGGLPNVNTAPGPVLQLVLGISEEETKTILRARETQIFNDLAEIYALIGRELSLMEMEISFWSSTYYRLSVWYEGSNRMREIHFKQASKDSENDSPWKMSYIISVPLAEDQRNANFTSIESDLFQKANK